MARRGVTQKPTTPEPVSHEFVWSIPLDGRSADDAECAARRAFKEALGWEGPLRCRVVLDSWGNLVWEFRAYVDARDDAK